MTEQIGFIFDLDGTLLNSTDIGKNIQGQIMEKFNIVITEERKKELEALAESMFEEDYTTWLAVKIIWTLLREVGLTVRQRLKALILAGKLYKKELIKLRLYDGTEKLLQFLDGNRYEYVIVTNSSKKSMKRNLSRLPEFYEKMKTKIITKDDVKNMKPHPESFKKAVEIMNLHHNRIVVVGDTKFDILFGKSVNAITIGVLTGIYSEEYLLKYEPDFVFNSVADIPMNIEKIKVSINKNN